MRCFRSSRNRMRKHQQETFHEILPFENQIGVPMMVSMTFGTPVMEGQEASAEFMSMNERPCSFLLEPQELSQMVDTAENGSR